MFYVYGNAGCINDVINDLKNYSGDIFSSLDDVLNFCVSEFDSIHSIKDLDIIYWSYDYRIDKHVFMIRQNIPGYDSPQFCRFLVEI